MNDQTGLYLWTWWSRQNVQGVGLPFITEEDITITNIVYQASMLKARNPSVETVYAIDNYPGLRSDCKASMYKSTIENCAIFKNILEMQGVQIY